MNIFKTSFMCTILFLLSSTLLMGQQSEYQNESASSQETKETSDLGVSQATYRYIEPILFLNSQSATHSFNNSSEKDANESFVYGATFLFITHKNLSYGVHANITYTTDDSSEFTMLSILPYVRYAKTVSSFLAYHSDFSAGKRYNLNRPRSKVEQHYVANYDFRVAFKLSDKFLLSTSLFHATLTHSFLRQHGHKTTQTNASIGTVLHSPTLNLVFQF